MKELNVEEQTLMSAVKATLGKLLLGSEPSMMVDMYEDGSTYVSASKMFVEKSEHKEYERLVTGVVLEPGVPDLHGEVVENEDEVYKAMQSFMLHSQNTNVDHIAKSDAKVVESWITREDTQINGVDIVKGTWLMTMQLPEEEFEGVLKGDFTGFSVGCLGNREPILMAKRKYEGKPKNTLKNLSFESEGAHVALVDKAANGHDLLIIKKEGQEEQVVKSKEEILKDLSDLLASALSQQEQKEKEVVDDSQTAVSILESIAELVGQLVSPQPEIDTSGGAIDSTESATQLTETTMPMVEKSEEIMTPEEIQKAVEDKVQKALEEVNKKHEAEKAELVATVEQLTKAEEDRQEGVFKSELANLNGLELSDEQVTDLYKFATAKPEIWKSIKSVCEKAVSAMENASDLEETGYAAGEGEVHETPEKGGIVGLSAEVQKRAEAIRAEDPTITEPMAVAKALKEKHSS